MTRHALSPILADIDDALRPETVAALGASPAARQAFLSLACALADALANRDAAPTLAALSAHDQGNRAAATLLRYAADGAALGLTSDHDAADWYLAAAGVPSRLGDAADDARRTAEQIVGRYHA